MFVVSNLAASTRKIAHLYHITLLSFYRVVSPQPRSLSSRRGMP